MHLRIGHVRAVGGPQLVGHRGAGRRGGEVPVEQHRRGHRLHRGARLVGRREGAGSERGRVPVRRRGDVVRVHGRPVRHGEEAAGAHLLHDDGAPLGADGPRPRGQLLLRVVLQVAVDRQADGPAGPRRLRHRLGAGDRRAVEARLRHRGAVGAGQAGVLPVLDPGLGPPVGVHEADQVRRDRAGRVGAQGDGVVVEPVQAQPLHRVEAGGRHPRGDQRVVRGGVGRQRRADRGRLEAERRRDARRVPHRLVRCGGQAGHRGHPVAGDGGGEHGPVRVEDVAAGPGQHGGDVAAVLRLGLQLVGLDDLHVDEPHQQPDGQQQDPEEHRGGPSPGPRPAPVRHRRRT